VPSALKTERLVAEDLARQAGLAILEIKDEARAGAREKDADQGPVTEADLRADAVLREGLGIAFPDDDIITEETWKPGTPIHAAPRMWLVDPLDGTKDFVRGGPDYAVMIGLVIDGQPALGVIYQPETELMWSASVPDGIVERVNPDGSRVALDVGERRVGRSGLRIAASRSHKTKLGTAVSKHFGAEVIEKGSVGLKIGLILDDEADLYLSGSRRIKVWDTAGPAALILAAGGDLRDVDNQPLTWVGPAAHGNGVRAYCPSAQTVYGSRIDALIADYRRREGGMKNE